MNYVDSFKKWSVNQLTNTCSAVILRSNAFYHCKQLSFNTDRPAIFNYSDRLILVFYSDAIMKTLQKCKNSATVFNFLGYGSADPDFG